MLNLFNTYLQSCRGAIAVETAVVTPILIFIFLPSVDLGLKVHTLQKMNQAADSGIEYVVNGGRDEAKLRNIVGDSYGRTIAQSDLIVEASCGCIIAGSGSTEGGDGDQDDNDGNGFQNDPYAGYYIKTVTSLSDDMCAATCDNGQQPSALLKVAFSQSVKGAMKTQQISTHLQTRIR